jgi:hypothetical protein
VEDEVHAARPEQAEAAGRPLWQHALVLLALLAALAAWTGTRSAFVTDESYLVIQLDTIEATGAWTLPHPLPEVDPQGTAFPLHGASRYESGYTLYGKHPLLVYLYLPIHRAFGLAGLIGVSILGTVGAAAAAGALAERILRRSGPAALWLVGVGSPLFFDAFVIHAHTIAAACAGLAALLAVRLVERRSLALAVALVVAVLGGALLRTEGAFFGVALGAALGVVGLVRRRLDLVALAGAAGGVAAAARLLDARWAGAVAGGRPVSLGAFTQAHTTFLWDRITSLTITAVMPGYRGTDGFELATLVGAALVIAGAVAVRRRPQEHEAVLLAAVGAGVLAVRSVLEWGAVPGLLVAWCVGVAGLVLLPGGLARAATTRLLLGCSAVYVVAVALTQYKSGGHTEWGGRYFALALPLLGAVAAASLTDALASMPRRSARGLRASLLVATAALAVLAVTTVRASHDRNRERSDEVLAAAAALPAAPDGRPPVVVTEDDQVPRLARGRYHEVRLLTVLPPFVRTYLDRLAEVGVRDVLVVSLDPHHTAAQVPPAYEQVGPVLPHELQWTDGGGLLHLHLRDA